MIEDIDEKLQFCMNAAEREIKRLIDERQCWDRSYIDDFGREIRIVGTLFGTRYQVIAYVRSTGWKGWTMSNRLPEDWKARVTEVIAQELDQSLFRRYT